VLAASSCLLDRFEVLYALYQNPVFPIINSRSRFLIASRFCFSSSQIPKKLMNKASAIKLIAIIIYLYIYISFLNRFIYKDPTSSNAILFGQNVLM